MAHRPSLLVLSACVLLAAPARADVRRGDRAADFEQKTLDGSLLRLSSLRGKVVLLDFWASWCEPCKRELPLLSKMAAKLKARGIEIVTVNIDQVVANARSFLRANGVALTVVGDQDKRIVGQYGPPKMPSSYAIDRGGVVRAVNEGFESGDEQKIERSLLALAGAP